jgi:hypothetical protein
MPVARAGREDSFAGRWIGRQKPNARSAQSRDLTSCGFLLRDWAKREVCNSETRVLDKLEVEIRANLSLFLLALKRKCLSLCLSGCIKVCKMMRSVLKFDSNFYILLTVHLCIILMNNQLDTQFLLCMFIYFDSVHVSSNPVLIIRRVNCINTISDICRSV